ncbi:MAG: TetR/AcrR family transcriptional regulator [Clostridiaceae bacterium]
MENTNDIRILQTAHQLFNARGYKNVTIKDLADELGMSKKTIYQYFQGKEEIATAVVEDSMKKISEATNISELQELDPLIAVREMLKFIKDESIRFGPLFLMDIEKYLPELAYRFKEFRNERKRFIEGLLKNAQDIGLVRDIPIELATEVLSVTIRGLVKSEFVSQHGYSISDVLDLYLDIFCRGISSSKDSNNAAKI